MDALHGRQRAMAAIEAAMRAQSLALASSLEVRVSVDRKLSREGEAWEGWTWSFTVDPEGEVRADPAVECPF